MGTDRQHRLLALFREGRIGEDELLAHLAAEWKSEDRAASAPSSYGNHLIRALDGYRAAEQSGAETLRAWADLTSDIELRGALRVIAAREAAHAELLEQRLRELGGEPAATVPDWLKLFNAELLAPARSDTDRMRTIVERFPDVSGATAALRGVIDQLRDDALSRELLRTIAEEEELTLRWFHEAWSRRSSGSSES